MRLQSPPGVEDVLPSQISTWQWLESEFRHHLALYGFSEIRTPTFEFSEVFLRTAGETSEIVTKQMFKVLDQGDRDLSLKPESTAPVMRAVIQHNLCLPGTVGRFYYVSSPHFRQERKQKGRLKEHHQFGCELVGVSGPAGDAETVEIAATFLDRIGISELPVSINSLGGSDCRVRYSEAILNHFGSWLRDQSEENKARAMKNPLRLLDTKEEALLAIAQEAPSILDFLEPESQSHFEKVQEFLSRSEINYKVNHRIVRGLDYYTGLVFEIESGDLGAQASAAGGGRYDGLVKLLGGSPTPAVGFGMGIERLILILEAKGLLKTESNLDVFVVYDKESGVDACHDLLRTLRKAEIACACDLDGASFKSQMRQADKLGSSYVAILGADEVSAGKVSLKDMATGEQELTDAASMVKKLERRRL